MSVPVPAPSNAAGKYNATYRIEAPSFEINKDANGVLVYSCSYNTVITGTLTVVLEGGPGTYRGHFEDRWTESEGAKGTCPPTILSPLSSPGPFGVDSAVSATSIQFGHLEQGAPLAASFQVRTWNFVGAVSGSTVVGRISQSRLYTGTINGAPFNFNGSLFNSEGYPLTSVGVTLVRQ